MQLAHRTILLALLGSGLLAAAAKGDEAAGKSRVLLEIPGYNRLRHLRVASVDPSGAVRLEVAPDLRNIRSTITEGYYVMVVDPETSPGPARLVRARVNEVVAPDRFELTVGSEAARRLKVGDACYLARPENATTAQLRTLPDLIVVGKKPTDSAAARIADQRARSILNLRLIGLALHNFESANGQFPPAVVYGPDGRPWHSWRVFLLPYLEAMDLYEQYDFSEPWDSEKNRKLLDKMPDVFRDPIHGDAKSRFTHYAALVGTWKAQFAEVHTVFPPAGVKMRQPGQPPLLFLPKEGVALKDVTDGLDSTIAVAPVSPDRKIPWTKPEDINVNAKFPGLNQPGGIAAPYPTGADLKGPRSAPVLLASGHPLILLDTVKPEDLRAMANRDGRNAGFFVEDIDFLKIPTLPEPKSRVNGNEPTLKIESNGPESRAWVER